MQVRAIYKSNKPSSLDQGASRYSQARATAMLLGEVESQDATLVHRCSSGGLVQQVQVNLSRCC